MKNLFFLPIIILISLASCTKEIHIDLNDSNPKLVIEANYIATDSVVYVKVSQTGSYFDEFSINVTNDAVVSIKENNGSYVSVPFVGDGVYKLVAYAPTYGASYTIQVIHNGVAHEASSLLMPTMDFLSSSYEYLEESFFSDAGYSVTYSFQDPVGVGNCYKIVESYDDQRFDKFGEFRVGNDAYTDGNIRELKIREAFNMGDTILLELQSINQAVYDYYDQLSSNTSGFTAAQGNPNYYWSNEALGYFSAYGYKQLEIVIE